MFELSLLNFEDETQKGLDITNQKDRDEYYVRAWKRAMRIVDRLFKDKKIQGLQGLTYWNMVIEQYSKVASPEFHLMANYSRKHSKELAIKKAQDESKN